MAVTSDHLNFLTQEMKRVSQEKMTRIKLIFLGFGCTGKCCSKFISTYVITQRVLESGAGGNCKNPREPEVADQAMNW